MDSGSAVRLSLKFKGSRNYLHGTDIFDALVGLAADASAAARANLRISFYKPITQAVEAVPLLPGTKPEFRPSAVFELELDGAPMVWALRERSGESVEGRYSYDEGLVVAGAVIDGRTISQRQPTPYSFVERVVALHKRLLDDARQDPKVTWWFSRLELRQLPPRSPALRLSIETELGGRLVKSSVDIDGEHAGSIYFSEKTT